MASYYFPNWGVGVTIKTVNPCFFSPLPLPYLTPHCLLPQSWIARCLPGIGFFKGPSPFTFNLFRVISTICDFERTCFSLVVKKFQERSLMPEWRGSVLPTCPGRPSAWLLTPFSNLPPRPAQQAPVPGLSERAHRLTRNYFTSCDLVEKRWFHTHWHKLSSSASWQVLWW